MQGDPRHCKGKAGQVYVQQSKGIARQCTVKAWPRQKCEGVVEQSNEGKGEV